MFDIYCSVYNFHRHKFQGVASEAGPRTSTSGGQRCLRLQPTQTIQVTSARERSILTNKKQHQYHYCAVTFLYFLHVRIFVQLLMALSFTELRSFSSKSCVIVQVSSSRDGVTWRRGQGGM